MPGVQAATTPASVDLVALAAGRAATVSVPSAQAVLVMAGVLGLPGLPATGLQARGPAGGEAAHAPAALGRAGPAMALRLLGLLGADVRLALLLPLLSPPLSPLARLPAFKLAPATVFVSPLPQWTPLRLPPEAPPEARVLVPGPLLWPALLLPLSVFSALPFSFRTNAT